MATITKSEEKGVKMDIAIVAESNFWKWYVVLDKPFGKLVGIGEKYFKPDDIDNAWSWLKE